jgi:RHS repeat-associated protein
MAVIPSGETWRFYYFAGASRVAMRTADSTTSSLVYFLGDHLGSTSITVNPDGSKIAEMRYTAWGETRYTSGVTPTDYQYTGQRNESAIGLYYYNARWYDPVLGRFAQADTIVPGGVQGLDRYAYVNNSPMMYTDPSGHFIPSPEQMREFINAYRAENLYGITFEGNWSDENKQVVMTAVQDVANAFLDEYNQGCVALQWEGETCEKRTAAEIFQEVYGTATTTLVFLWGNDAEGQFWFSGDPISGGGLTVGRTSRSNGTRVLLIKFASLSRNFLSARDTVVHELGHLFNTVEHGLPYKAMSGALEINPLLRRPDTGSNYGFASSGFPWQQSFVDVDDYWEVFADQFLGWVYNTWETDEFGQLTVAASARSIWMNINMAEWLK